MINVEVCVGSACHLKGAYNVINKLQKLIDNKGLKNKVTVKAAFCLGNCTNAVSVKINNEGVLSVSEDNVEEFFEKNIAGRL
ncbi:NADH dehydrogenase subunit E [Clostridium acetireducens DSM 10703]|uniref:NADH dehydrogenase subunit E n=1 Tax=Clostridium acetireducens DSM 10703 TaxID=1121290 RepID=A0A1E8F1B5_9CLOT|nr:(2Fe-2S) ferredoxin domain-containing protein [Clostridium acetireducens]OFI07257.1 NADH dehydrogenase subunit E [Clostridium acetireducens DSM 10703]